MRVIVKYVKQKRKLFVDHPISGELVEWGSMGAVEQKIAIRQHFREYFDTAYNELLGALSDPIDGTAEEQDLAAKASKIGETFLKYLSGLDPDATQEVNRGGFPVIMATSSIKRLGKEMS